MSRKLKGGLVLAAAVALMVLPVFQVTIPIVLIIDHLLLVLLAVVFFMEEPKPQEA